MRTYETLVSLGQKNRTKVDTYATKYNFELIELANEVVELAKATEEKPADKLKDYALAIGIQHVTLVKYVRVGKAFQPPENRRFDVPWGLYLDNYKRPDRWAKVTSYNGKPNSKHRQKRSGTTDLPDDAKHAEFSNRMVRSVQAAANDFERALKWRQEALSLWPIQRSDVERIAEDLSFIAEAIHTLGRERD
jgi:hypothetical protein